MDFSAREAREPACRREVELYRCQAPDVYLGVADVLGPDGRPRDHLVVMRRMPAGRRLAALVRSGADVSDRVRQVARVMAAFHERVAPSPTIAAAVDAVRGDWEDNFRQMAPFQGSVLDPELAARAEHLALPYLACRRALFEHRMAAGMARDGHGDLLAEDIFLLDDGPRVLDCLERLGAPDLAARFLDWSGSSRAIPIPPRWRSTTSPTARPGRRRRGGRAAGAGRPPPGAGNGHGWSSSWVSVLLFRGPGDVSGPSVDPASELVQVAHYGMQRISALRLDPNATD